MRRYFLDVEYGEAVCPEYLLHRRERQVREVLVVDGIELVFGEQPQKMRKFERRDAVRLQHIGKPGDKAVDVGHVRQNVIGGHQVSLLALGRQPSSDFSVKK